MPDVPACPHCRAWLPCPEDAWCAHCGEPVARLRLRLEPDVLQIRQMAPPVRVVIGNGSCAELPVESVSAPAWARLAPLPGRLLPGQTVSLTARLDTLRLGEPQAASFAVQTPAGQASAGLLLIAEHPEALAEPAELEVWAREPRLQEVALAPRAGALRIREVRRTAQAGSIVLLTLPEPVVATAAEPLRMRLKLEDAKLRGSPSLLLEVVYDSPLGPRVAPVAVQLVAREPPRLSFLGENEAPPELFQSPGQRLEVRVGNGSAPAGRTALRSARLQVLSAELHCPGPGCAVRLLTPLPATLGGGEMLRLAFLLDLQNVRPQNLCSQDTPGNAGGGAVSLGLRVVADWSTLECAVPVRVRPLPVFDGLLALDFGTSNTCAAVVETGREPEMLPLDGGETTSPTLLRYRTLAGAAPVVETGARIERLAGTDDRSAAATLRGLKQRLAEPAAELPVRPYDEAEWTTRRAADAAADYLQALRRVAETSRGAAFREFLVTHPAVCPLGQYRALRAALHAAFGGEGVTVRFLQEPVAALVPFLATQAQRLPAPAAYTAASFDLGGGTTDLAIVHVEHVATAPGRREIRPAILYSRGVRFGGEDLTAFLVERLRAAAEALLQKSRPGTVLIGPETPGTARENALRNSFALRAAAEEFKRSLSESRGPESGVPGVCRLRVLPPGDAAPEDRSLALLELTGSGGESLRTAFTVELVRRVGALAELLAEAEAHTAPLQFLQLSGKTSSLPAVAEVLRARFPRAAVSRAADPKECVVQGACLSRVLASGSATRLVLPDTAARTTSAIGLYDAHTATFTVVLPVDTAIPAGGLLGEAPGGWFGSEPVALFENLSVSERELRVPGAGSRLLGKLGTWVPERECPAAAAQGWTLRLLLRGLELEVTAKGPAGEEVRFHESTEGGAAW